VLGPGIQRRQAAGWRTRHFREAGSAAICSKVRPWQIRRLRPEKLKLRELIRATLAPNEQRPADVRRRHRIGHDAI
jgi:hypothetical protein